MNEIFLFANPKLSSLDIDLSRLCETRTEQGFLAVLDEVAVIALIYIKNRPSYINAAPSLNPPNPHPAYRRASRAKSVRLNTDLQSVHSPHPPLKTKFGRTLKPMIPDSLKDCPLDLKKCIHALLIEIFEELTLEGLLLFLHGGVQVEVLSTSFNTDPVWAYFPANRRSITQRVKLKPDTRVLLVFFMPDVESWPYEETLGKLRHHVGHALLFLRKPQFKHNCCDADKEWERWSQDWYSDPSDAGTDSNKINN